MMETLEVDGVKCVVIHLVVEDHDILRKFCNDEPYGPPTVNYIGPITLCEQCNLKVMRPETKPEKIFDWTAETQIETAVGEAVGAASVCWESMEGTGVFQSDRAKKIVDELVAFIMTKQPIY